MKQSKQTKQAFLMSVLAMLLCVTMLVGTTMAWFTDSVTTGVNKIVAGNLDVELERALFKEDGTFDKWESVQDKSLFDENARWEPGYTQVVYLKVKNAGSLALKYRLSVTSAKETPGTSVMGGQFNLSDYLVFGQAKINGETNKFASREEAWNAVGATKGLNNYIGDAELAPGTAETESEDYVALIVYMPTTVGNEANHQTGTTAPSIELGVKLEATQAQQEEDTFGPDYDGDAWLDMVATDNKNGTYEYEVELYVKDANAFVPVTASPDVVGLYTAEDGTKYAATPEALNTAIGDSGSATLVQDLNAGDKKNDFFAIGSTTTINGNGKTLTTSAPADNGTRVIDVYLAEAATITIDDVVVTGDTTSGEKSYLRYGIGMWDNPNATLNISNSTVEAGHYALAVQNGNDNMAVNITNTTLKGYCGFQTFSPNTNATFENSHIIGVNQWNAEGSNDFAAVCLMADEYSNSAGSVLTFNNCKIEAKEQDTAKERFFSLRTDCTLNLNGCTFVKNGVTVSTEDLIKDIQGETELYVWCAPGANVTIFVDGVQVK